MDEKSLYPFLREVWEANIRLYKSGLVIGTQGNVSGMDRERGWVAIKPSGVPYEILKVEDIVVVNMEGKVIWGERKPSVDTPHHLYLYKNLEGIGGIVHTHSPYATIFSILGIAIPVLSTAHADVFGEEIPVTPYVDNIGSHIGEAILKHKGKRSSAILLGKHGVFTFAKNSEKAVFYAEMTEYVARTSYYALLLGNTLGRELPLPLPEEEIKKWYERYHSSRYGQAKD